MHLRRALLLFAIVLGLAAIVTTVSEPSRRDDGKRSSTSSGGVVTGAAVPPAPASTEQIRFTAGEAPRRVRLPDGRSAAVSVSTDEAGQVDIPELGLTDAAEQHSPATFEVLATRPGRYAVRFTPAAGSAPETVGTIVVPEAAGG